VSAAAGAARAGSAGTVGCGAAGAGTVGCGAAGAGAAGEGLPDEAYAAALAGLPAAGHRRLRRLLERWPAAEAWHRVRTGRAGEEPALSHLWRAAAASTAVDRVWADVLAAGVGVAICGGAGFPSLLADDPEPPAVVFWRGDLAALEGRRVAIVGTRRCTRYGRELARELGRDLAIAGVRVVSGLALGVDGASHAGALEAGDAAAPPVAVVGSGPDVVYPRHHAELWAAVARRGVLLSEYPLGTPPEPWRFPVRNRVIAALAEVVVVVESHSRGGSRYTVDAADERGRTVMAVPGSVRSPASAYTNALLADGCPPVRDVTDVLVALGLSSATANRATAGGGFSTSDDPRPAPVPDEADVLDALSWEPASLEQVVLRSGRSPGEITMALVHLERDGWVASRHGWWERVAAVGRGK
jgi:DNA processing protein